MGSCLTRPGLARLVATLVAGCVTAGLMLAGCGGSSSAESSPPPETAPESGATSPAQETVAAETGGAPAAAGEGFDLGFAYGLENTPIYQNVLQPTEVYAEELGIDLTLGSADSKCDKQLSDIENMIAAGVRAITFLGLCGEGARTTRS